MQSDTIGQLALKYLRDFAFSTVAHAVFIREDETKDEAMVFKSYFEANRAWDELLRLHLISDEHREPWVGQLEEKTGRKFRMFHLTEYGRVMDNIDLYARDDKGEVTWQPKYQQ